ncbi:MAG: methylated-DNA--[protein]-cysteine S-methyltransferase [Capnocytophaga sp.]|nr:methylated-DNA--[protein]-cysteine S-methyltransferase [Capnocytophaga sp.]
MNKIYRKEIYSPLGTLIVCASENGICLLEFSDGKGLETELKQIEKSLKAKIKDGENPLFAILETELNLYFQGKLKQFSVPLQPIGTDFQKKVWEELCKISYGKTISYQRQANNLDIPKSVRAVANANGQNKIAILIPCHRVIGTNGKLTGYAGGIWRKEKLLEIEKNHFI